MTHYPTAKHDVHIRQKKKLLRIVSSWQVNFAIADRRRFLYFFFRFPLKFRNAPGRF